MCNLPTDGQCNRFLGPELLLPLRVPLRITFCSQLSQQGQDAIIISLYEISQSESGMMRYKLHSFNKITFQQSLQLHFGYFLEKIKPT